jgi:hypothetical protein
MSTLLALACASCTTAPDGRRVDPPTVRATAVAPESLGLPDTLRIDAALQRSTDLQPWSYGPRVGVRYVAFGVAPPGADPSTGEQAADQFGRYAVVDLSTRVVTTGQTARRGAYSQANAVFPHAGSEYLIRVETWPEVDPATACPDNPQYCWSWAVYVRRLPDGAEAELERSSAPGLQFLFPKPVVASDAVYWQSTGSRRSSLASWRPDRGITRLGGDDVPPGNLTVAADAWIGTPPRFDDKLVKVPVDESRPQTIDLPKHSSNAAVRGDRFAYRQELPEDGVQLMLGDLAHPTTATALRRLQDIYRLDWADDDTVVVLTPQGRQLIRSNGSATALPVDAKSGLNVDNGKLAFMAGSGPNQILVVAHLVAATGTPR